MRDGLLDARFAIQRKDACSLGQRVVRLPTAKGCSRNVATAMKSSQQGTLGFRDSVRGEIVDLGKQAQHLRVRLDASDSDNALAWGGQHVLKT
jgi:hypothetical protein